MSITTLQHLLAANAAVSRFDLVPGFEGRDAAVGVCEAELTAIPCDAFVVPHFRENDRRIGVSWEVEKAGGKAGLDAYDTVIAERKDEIPRWGEVVVTRSGGGLSAHLLHVVCLCSGIRSEDGMVVYATMSALHEAQQHRFKRVVFPPLGTGVLGILGAELSAPLMFGTMTDHWRKNSGADPVEVLIAVGREDHLYTTYANVLRGNVAPKQRNGKPTSSLKQAVHPPAPAAQEWFRDRLLLLSDLELASLVLSLQRNGQGFQQHCLHHPWYAKMEAFFLPDGSLDEGMAAEIREEATRRTR